MTNEIFYGIILYASLDECVFRNIDSYDVVWNGDYKINFYKDQHQLSTLDLKKNQLKFHWINDPVIMDLTDGQIQYIRLKLK